MRAPVLSAFLVVTGLVVPATAASAQEVPLRLLEALNRLGEADGQVRIVNQGPTPPARQLTGFGIALVLGEMAGNASTQGIPPPAAKALADLKDFLPYRSYQLLDTQWAAMAGGALRTSLHRPGQAYELFMNVSMVSPSEVFIQNFGLTEIPGAVISPTNAKEIRQVLSSSFRMDLGETVVVGTSKIAGDRALIVLLTAVAK